MVAILFALITYLGWGIGDIFGTMASRKIGGYNSAFYVSAIGFILSSFYAPFVLSDLAKFTQDILFLTIILAFFIFKDKITRQQIAGIITTLVGIVLLSVFSI